MALRLSEGLGVTSQPLLQAQLDRVRVLAVVRLSMVIRAKRRYIACTIGAAFRKGNDMVRFQVNPSICKSKANGIAILAFSFCPLESK